MSKLPKKIHRDGKVFYALSEVARSLGTNTAKVRQLISAGKMEASQFRINGKLLVSAESLVAYTSQLQQNHCQ